MRRGPQCRTKHFQTHCQQNNIDPKTNKNWVDYSEQLHHKLDESLTRNQDHFNQCKANHNTDGMWMTLSRALENTILKHIHLTASTKNSPAARTGFHFLRPQC